MRQRLHLARAMLGNPRVIFLDEPTSGIDPQGVRDMHRIIQGFASDDRTVVVTTHQLNELPLFCERVGILHGGKLLYEDSLAAMEARALDIEGALVVSLAGVAEADLAALRAELEAGEGVHTATSESDDVVTLRVTGPNLSRLTTDSLGRLSTLGDAVRAIDVKRASLDDVYLSIVAAPTESRPAVVPGAS